MTARTPITPEQIARAQLLRDEGMTCPYIGEDIGVTAHEVQLITTAPPDAQAEWNAAWSQIRRHPRLLKLHQELSPKSAAMHGSKGKAS